MSKTLSEKIRCRIREAGGWLSFEAFMHEALYARDSGYYESAHVFGEGGDFVTGAEIGPWLALGLADLAEWGWRNLGEPSEWTLLEQGGGEGRLMSDVLQHIRERNMPMPRAIAVERSARMRSRQAARYEKVGLRVAQFAGLDEVQSRANLIFFCNELPDAFPVRCFARRKGEMFERGVGLDADGAFIWRERPLSDAPEIDETIVAAWPDGYISEWNPHLAAWLAGVGRVMDGGYLFCVDYGFAQSEYYRPQRMEGTLMAHLRHEASGDVLTDPGSRDITAHIDFTALARAARRAGFGVHAWMPQGAWLAQSPAVQECIRQAAMQRDAASMATMSAAKRMLMPQGMGELFKLCMLGKGVDAGAPAFLSAFDRRHALGCDVG